jgi:enoyl-CoA hydratase/carnithine racemase
LSRLQCSKPIIAAVNGGAYGGGVEMVLNCDFVVAGEDAKFALPEVKRGVVAIQGGRCPRVPFVTVRRAPVLPVILTGLIIFASANSYHPFIPDRWASGMFSALPI